MTTDERPSPTPDALTRPYWDALKERRFMLPRCEACGRFHFYPRPTCPHCCGKDISWSEVSGRGTIYSFTHVHRAPSPAFSDSVPYTIAIVELDEGPHMMSEIVNCHPDNVRIGEPLHVCFRDRGDITLALFEPNSGESGREHSSNETER